MSPKATAEVDILGVKPVFKISVEKGLPLFTVLFVSILIQISISHGGPRKHEAGIILSQNFADPDVDAHAFLVRLAGNDKPLIKQREWKRLAPASLTKLLTSVLVVETMTEKETITFSADAKKTAEKTSRASAGEQFMRDEAIKLAIINSANDAALALAENVGQKFGGLNFNQSLDIFNALMNEKAIQLGLTDSSFKNPVGFDEDGHFSTAVDLAKLAEYIWYNHPRVWEISRITETDVFSVANNEYNLKNTDDLLNEYPAILGSKTGFTEKAKGALLLIYPVRPDKAAIIVILGSNNRFEDGRKIINWLEGLSLR